LEFGSQEDPERRPDRISTLKKLVEQCGDTLLGKWAAARLGIEETNELEKKYPDGLKLLDQYREGKTVEPLVEQAHSYLSTAYKLPDEFPVRERILYELPKAELIKGNYKKALSLLDELGKKYPNGEYGKRSDNAKEELKKLIEREKGSTPPALWTKPSFLIVIAAGIGIVVIILIFLLKKKAHSRSK
jgi:hypothetical protein